MCVPLEPDTAAVLYAAHIEFLGSRITRRVPLRPRFLHMEPLMVVRRACKFDVNSPCFNAHTWLQMWETAEKAGVVTANLMWPGPPMTRSGASSTYLVPWKVSTLYIYCDFIRYLRYPGQGSAEREIGPNSAMD